MTSVTRAVMGMPVTIEIRTPLPSGRAERLLAQAFTWLSWVDATFSTYLPESQVSRIGRDELDPRHAHPAVREVIAACDMLAAATGGYFDVLATGRFDPSGYVKGWAAERVSRVLHAGGAVDHCVDAGGDVRVRGLSAPHTGWRVGIRDPAGRVVQVVGSRDLAVATSGGYERGRHIRDPVNGGGAAGLASVTVIGPDLGVADAYATALFAGGADPARLPVLATPLPAGYGVFIIDHDGRGFLCDTFHRATRPPAAAPSAV